MKNKIFDWNYISDKLSEEQITELKKYYHTYHRKCWLYKYALKRFKKWKLLGNTLSVLFCLRRNSIISGYWWCKSCCNKYDSTFNSRLDDT